jgi:hypothetical protein
MLYLPDPQKVQELLCLHLARIQPSLFLKAPAFLCRGFLEATKVGASPQNSTVPPSAACSSSLLLHLPDSCARATIKKARQDASSQNFLLQELLLLHHACTDCFCTCQPHVRGPIQTGSKRDKQETKEWLSVTQKQRARDERVGTGGGGGGHMRTPSCRTRAPRTASSFGSIKNSSLTFVVKGPIDSRNLVMLLL